MGVRARVVRALTGRIRYNRRVYRCAKCNSYHAPLDREIGLVPGQELTPGLLRKVAYASARSSYAQASQDLIEYLSLEVSPAEFARVAEEEGARFDRLQCEREAARRRPASPERPAEPPEIPCKRLVLEADATCVLTVKGEEHKSVYCGKAFGLEDRIRKDGSRRPMIVNKRYSASAEDMEDFGARLKALAYQMGLRQSQSVAFIADGAHCLWNWAEANLPANAVLIQDFWHVCEHLSELSKDLYGARWKEKFKAWKTALRESRVSEVIEELVREHERRRGEKRKYLGKEITYLKNGQHRMDYARYEQEGWPIGSGAIEGTCKHLVKERFCVTGAQWRRKNIPKVLAMRLSMFNGSWDQDWKMSRAA